MPSPDLAKSSCLSPLVNWFRSPSEAAVEMRGLKRRDRNGPVLFLARRRGDAQRVGGIDAEDLDLARKEGELLERQRQWPIFGMRFDIGVELGGRESAADHVAFELGHVDPVGGEPAHGLV